MAHLQGLSCKGAGGGLFTRACCDRIKGNGLNLKKERSRSRLEEILFYEGGEALE